MHDFLTHPYSRELMEDFNIGYSVARFNDLEIQKSIVEDVLMAHYVGVLDGVHIKMTQQELLKFCPGYTHRRIIKMMDLVLKMGFIRFDENQCLVPVPENMQASMDFCGSWFDGFTPPADAKDVYCINYDALDKAIAKTGSIENLVKSLAMDVNANTPGVGHA